MFPKRKIGKTSLETTILGFGAAPLGNLYRPVENNLAKETLEAAIGAGIGYFDTAPYYGFGLSERRIGDVLRNLQENEYVLSSKVGRLLTPIRGYSGVKGRHGYCSPMPFEPVYDYSYDAIMRSYEDSLQRLGLAKIDILLVHDIGTMTHGEENDLHFKTFIESGYKALDELRSSGEIAAIGLGVNESEICEQAMEHGSFDCFLLAGRYSLLEQDAMNSMLPKCEKHGASIIMGGIYNSGILATGTKTRKPSYNYKRAPRVVIKKVRKIEEVCKAHNVPLPAAALQFPLAHKLTCCVIPGISSPKRVEQSIDLYKHEIPTDFWKELKEQKLLREDAPTP